jgi:hypothetical protein
LTLLHLIFDALIFLQRAEPFGLDAAVVREKIRTTVVRLDETEAFVSIEEFNSASLGHASGPFLSTRSWVGITVLPELGVGQAVLDN